MYRAYKKKSLELLFYLIIGLLIFSMVGCGKNSDNQIDERIEIPETVTELNTPSNKIVTEFDTDVFADVDSGYNLYIYSGIVGAVEVINIYTPEGKLYDSLKHLIKGSGT